MASTQMRIIQNALTSDLLLLIICQKYPGVRGHFALSCLRQ